MQHVRADDNMTPEQRAQLALDRVWHNLSIGKVRLRGMNQKDQTELKQLLETVLKSSMGGAPESITVEIKAPDSSEPKAPEVPKEAIQNSVREVLQDQLGTLMEMVKGLAARTSAPAPVASATMITPQGTVSMEAAEAIKLHDTMFAGKGMQTNIDEVQVDGGEVSSVKGNLEELRKLQRGGGK